MADKLLWTVRANQQLRDLRKASATWHVIAKQMGVGRSAVIEQARRLGIQAVVQNPAASPPARMRNDRPCMPPGHPLTWAAIIAGTTLEGEAYPFPVFL